MKLVKLLVLILVPALAAGTGLAAESGHRQGHSQHEAAGEIQRYAPPGSGAGKDFGAAPVHDNEVFYIFMADRLEYQTKEGGPIFLWDVQAMIGNDYDKLYLESEAEWLIEEEQFEELETEVFYGRNIATFWDLKIGLRHDFAPDPERTFAAFGVEGLAPQWFEVEATAYVSEDGDFSANIEAEYDLLLTQRLILQPRFELSLAAREVEEYGTGQGITDYELGLRLRYEIVRELAPYIGVSWSQKIAETGQMAEAGGEDAEAASLVGGVRMWF